MIGKAHNSVINTSGSAPFKAKKRPEIIDFQQNYDMPAPGDYRKQQMNKTFSLASKKHPKDRSPQFADKQKRFGKDDTLAPGPGTYTAPESCKVREARHAGADYRSTVNRDFDIHVVGKKNPGIGQYELTNWNSIGGQTMEGGGAPNNFTLCYKDMNASMHKVTVR